MILNGSTVDGTPFNLSGDHVSEVIYDLQIYEVVKEKITKGRHSD